MDGNLNVTNTVNKDISQNNFMTFSIRRDAKTAVPTIKNYTFDSSDEDERRSQPKLSAMIGPRPGGTAFMITVTSTPSKFKKSLLTLQNKSFDCLLTYFINIANCSTKTYFSSPHFFSVYMDIMISIRSDCNVFNNETTHLQCK